MIVSRKQLLLERIVDDNGMLQLNADGSACATNKKAFMAMEGVPAARREQVPLPGAELGAPSVSMTEKTAREVLKGVPRDKLFQGALEHVDVYAESSEDFRADTTDGRRSRTVRGRSIGRTFVPEPMIQRTLSTLDRGRVVCLNRRRLLRLLETMDRVAEDVTGESPVWIGIGENGDVALRCVDWSTGQRALGYMTAYRDEGAKQPEGSEWERRIYNAKRPKPRRRTG